jgi:DNA-binding CsgD family transcriptional regulator
VHRFDTLSKREREVVRLALRGRKNEAIARALGLAKSTVRVLMARAAAKVSVRTRAELLAKVARLGAGAMTGAGRRAEPGSGSTRFRGRRYLLAADDPPKRRGFERLSKREREVVQLALRGRQNRAIAGALGLADSTVRVLMARAAAKVDVRSRAELLAKAARLGVGSTRTRA